MFTRLHFQVQGFLNDLNHLLSQLKRVTKLPEVGLEKPEEKEAKPEASPDLKVKTFEEIMAEKKARRLGRFGGASADGNQSKRRLKVKQNLSQGNLKKQKSSEFYFQVND